MRGFVSLSMRALAIITFLLLLSVGARAQPGDAILSNFTVQQVSNHVRADFGILGGASCLGAELLRSVDGGLNWTIVAAIREVCGGTEFTETYTFNDEFPVSGVESIYRLELGGIGRTGDRKLTFVALFDDILAFPNPSNDHVTLRWDALPNAQFNVQVIALKGSVLYEQNLTGNHTRLSVHTFDRGLYVVVIREANGGQLFKTRITVY